MSRVSNRALVNFIVDAAIAAAFVVSAVSGLVFLVPAGWTHIPGTSSTSALAVGYATWRTLHDWTAVIMILGVVLHTALHWRWVTTMARRLAGGAVRRAGAPTAPEATPAPSAVAAVAPRVDARATTPAATAAATRVKWSAPDAPESADPEREGLDRRRFLKTAGVVTGAALVGGLVGRSAASAVVAWLGGAGANSGVATVDAETQGSAGQGWAWGEAAGSGDPGRSSAAGGSDGSSSASGSDDQAGTGSAQSPSSARVSIDATRCTACGACLQACPFGVFAVAGDTVVVADPAACRLCGHCAQACGAQAITLGR